MLVNTNSDIDEKKNLELLRSRKERYERRLERRKAVDVVVSHNKQHDASNEMVYEAEAPKLSVNMNATGKSMDVKVENVSVGVPCKQLIVDTTFSLVYGRKYGLIGRNGIGKSTLLR